MNVIRELDIGSVQGVVPQHVGSERSCKAALGTRSPIAWVSSICAAIVGPAACWTYLLDVRVEKRGSKLQNLLKGVAAIGWLHRGNRIWIYIEARVARLALPAIRAKGGALPTRGNGAGRFPER